MAADSSPQFASLYVGDLKPEVTEAMLCEVFNSVGPVSSIRVCRNSITRKSLGYGYVNFHHVSDAERAIETLNYSCIKGRSCRLMWSQRDPSLRKSGAGNIYVRDLDKNIDNKALYDTFSLFGNILSCKVAADPQGNSFGYGFVQYETEEAANQAIDRVSGMQIGEKTVTVCKFEKQQKGDPNENYTNLYIKSFPADWDEAKLTEFFSVVGPVVSAARRTDNKGRPFAFVAYEQPEDAKKAVETLNKKDLRSEEDIAAEREDGKEPALDADGHPVHGIYVGRAQTKAERAAEVQAKFQQKQTGTVVVSLYVKNLDENTDDDALRQLFEPFGEVKSASTPKDPDGKGKGYGFVSFTNADDATKAVTEMHLKVINEKALYVTLAESKSVRDARKMAENGKGRGKGTRGAKGNPMAPQVFGMMPPPMFGQQQMRGAMPAPGGMMMGGMMGPRGPMMGNQQQMVQMMAMLSAKGMPPQMMGKGGMPGMMGGMPMPSQMWRPPPMGMQGQPGSAPPAALNAAMLGSAPPAVQKQMIGEKLFQSITRLEPDLAGKITGMMLEMNNSELLVMLESEERLKHKVDEAKRVLLGLQAGQL